MTPPSEPPPRHGLQTRHGELLAEVIAALGHDLRGPLGAILGWTALLRRNAPEAMTRGLEVIERNARLQAWILEDLGELYALVANVTVTRREPLDLAALVADVFTQARQTLHADVVLEGADEPLRIVGDAKILRVGLRAVATHFCRAHGTHPRVSVGVEGTEALVRFVEATRGEFPFEALDAVAHGGESDGAFTRGAGLALLAVYHAAQAHGGSVRPIPDGLALTLPRSDQVASPRSPTEAHPTEAHPTEAHPTEAHPTEAHPTEAHPTEIR